MTLLLTNIQRFSLHDGPGIRTTVFLKGCSLRCPWCSNPENINNYPQTYIKNNIKSTYGKYYSTEALISECLKDKAFYDVNTSQTCLSSISSANIEKLPGGVTFSGGEALLQIESLVSVIKALHNEGVHVAVETSLFCSPSNLELAIKYIDFFYVDVKILDPDQCKTVEHGNLDLFLSNFHRLLCWIDKKGKHKPVVIRIPVIGTYTDILTNRIAVHDLISKYRDSILKIELIKEHNLGETKYLSLNMSFNYHGVEDSLLEQYRTELNDLEIATEICKI